MVTTRSTSKKPAPTTAKDVLWYIPNVIGYGRIVCVLVSWILLLLGQSPQGLTLLGGSSNTIVASLVISTSLALVLYICGFVGDLFDGMMARKFQQTSQFGGVLDMITDRCSTLGLLYLLGQEGSAVPVDYSGNERWSISNYPFVFSGLCLFLQVLDIASHWLQMHSSLLLGNLHHKSAQGNLQKHFLVQWFYQYYYFFGYLCVGAEFTYILLFLRQRLFTLLYYQQQQALETSYAWLTSLVPYINIALMVTGPGCIAKQAVNVMQLLSSCYAIAQADADEKNNKKTSKDQ